MLLLSESFSFVKFFPTHRRNRSSGGEHDEEGEEMKEDLQSQLETTNGEYQLHNTQEKREMHVIFFKHALYARCAVLFSICFLSAFFPDTFFFFLGVSCIPTQFILTGV